MTTNDRPGPAQTPEPPYVAVIFSALLSGADPAYDEMAEAMQDLARSQPGFLGVESARDSDGFGITVSYWRSEADVATWRSDVDHTEARRRGRSDWYERYVSRVARVERVATFER